MVVVQWYKLRGFILGSDKKRFVCSSSVYIYGEIKIIKMVSIRKYRRERLKIKCNPVMSYRKKKIPFSTQFIISIWARKRQINGKSTLTILSPTL